MKTLWRIVVLVLLLVAVLIIFMFWRDWLDYVEVDKNDQVVREKPIYREKVVVDDLSNHPGVLVDGEFKFADWDSVIILSDGPGSFISAIVSKKGGSGSVPGHIKTTVSLIVDRVEVLRRSFEVAKAIGLTSQNYAGVVWLEGDIVDSSRVETLVLGYAKELYFNEMVILAIKVDDPEVEKVLVQVTYTKEDTGDDEGGSGGDGEGEHP